MALYLGNQKVAPTIMPSSGGVSIPLEVSANGELRKPTSSFTWSLPSNVTDLESEVLYFAFYNCEGITGADLSSLTTISGGYAMGYAFYNCINMTNVDMSNLTIIGDYGMSNAFNNTSLQTLSFNSLKSTSFGSGTHQFSNMLKSVTGCTVHFPSNLQSVIGSWTDVTSGFGGTNTTVLFDLPGTE